MSSAWLLPEHIADVLPAEARRIEELRRRWLDLARSYGFELIAPPLLEHLDSLLSGTGSDLDLATFKLVDQLSGRLLGVRADTTPQAARIDAHLLNRQGVTRLCYCGPTLHTRPAGVRASREPLQFGAEIFGHAGLEADLEAQELALDGLALAGITAPMLDLADARVVRALFAGLPLAAESLADMVAALAAKDAGRVQALAASWPARARDGVATLLDLYGGLEVLAAARLRLPASPLLHAALDDLQWLATQLQASHPEVQIGIDLADLPGYAYYSGVRFAIYGAGRPDALVRGGRYDEVGAVFGRSRPAAGFSLDLKALAEGAAEEAACQPAIRAPWGTDAGLRTAVRALRTQGEVVVCTLPGHAPETEEFHCDRELRQVGEQWAVAPIQPRTNG